VPSCLSLPSLFAAPPPAPAILALADGTVLRGRSIGASGVTVAELVFNTSMTGYQEILTDPSYSSQIVVFTWPHIGNTGVNEEDVESGRIHAAGLVVRDCPQRLSSFRATASLPDYLKAQGIVAIAGVDTRRLTRLLREKGTLGACIVAADAADAVADPTRGAQADLLIARALQQAQAFGGIQGQDLASRVSTHTARPWQQGSWQLGHGYTDQAAGQNSAHHPSHSPAPGLHVVAYDFGVKANLLRLLADRGCKITVVPARTPAQDALALQPDGIFLSNGPGDPEPCGYAIAAVREFLARKIPLFGICLGHQILGLALGGKTVKMKTGHHGANHPVQDADGRVFITSQNHGFAVDAASLPANVQVTHTSLFDGTVQGLQVLDRPAFSFQGHPEASPGPHDVSELFDRFVTLMQHNTA